MKKTTLYRQLIDAEEILVQPGVYDGFSARLLQQMGFKSGSISGAGLSESTLGWADVGLLSYEENVSRSRNIAACVDIPLSADADTGYGNELNVVRTVRDYEQAGVAGIHIEDQVSPKRCGHLDDKEIVPREDWIAKIRAANDARRDKDFLIIARTDSRAVIGFEEAVSRSNEALANGADMAFLEAPQTMDEIAAVPKLVRGPCLLNVVWGGKTPNIDLREADKLGFKLAIVPGLLFKAVLTACDDVLAELKATHIHPAPKRGTTVKQAFDRVGAQEWGQFRTKFRDAEIKRAAE